MKLITTISEMQTIRRELYKDQNRIALVPTMGALHAGHVELIREARHRSDIVVVSVYVNPTQFGPNEDLANYPTNLGGDREICAREGVDVMFVPRDEEMYGNTISTWVEEVRLTKTLEGERRPGHFRGVCTVVCKLFNIIRPDLALFGYKDYQQLKVMQRMTRDLCYPIEILPVRTVREPDGLALSSRNTYLSAQDRLQAAVLWKSLCGAYEMFLKGENDSSLLRDVITQQVASVSSARLDYVEIVDGETMVPVDKVKPENVALLAVFFGKTRLIDNIVFKKQ